MLPLLAVKLFNEDVLAPTATNLASVEEVYALKEAVKLLSDALSGVLTDTTAVPPTIIADIPLPVKFIENALPCGIPSSNIGKAILAVMFVIFEPSPTN